MPTLKTAKPTPSDQLAKLLGGAVVLLLLDYGRDVLVPIVLAIFLGLLVAPLIRRLRHWGLGQVQAVAISVFLLFAAVSITAVVLGSQAIRLASSLPQYESTIRNKLQTLDRLTLGKLDALLTQADHLVNKLSPEPPAKTVLPPLIASPGLDGREQPVKVQIAEPHPKPFEIISKLAERIVPPLETGGIVFILLVFILLDFDLMRDRLIRLAGGSNLRATTQAITDATERLSRFFVSQFAVNALVGSLVAAGLGLAGISGALFWGALTAVSRFVPYIGIWLAAGAALLMSAAMAEGWAPVIHTLLVFMFVEIVVAQFFEPKLYGHSTGLSPLSVVISAIFWSALWGPVGLILSTPLTLCLVVAGRYVPALNFLEILLGDLPALSHVERFYQRALSGDAPELVRGLRQFLKDKPLREYCDQVLLASVKLAYIDFGEHEITRDEQAHMNRAVSGLIEAMSRKRSLRRSSTQGSVLRITAPDNGTPDSYRSLNPRRDCSILVTDIGDPVAIVVAKACVNVLHSEEFEARYLSHGALAEIEADADIPLVFITCVAPEDHARALAQSVAELRRRLPEAHLIVMRVLEEVDAPFARPTYSECGADAMVRSYQEMVDTSFRRLARQTGEATDLEV
ncbi:AI-2E family transporter [Uliginosibacterium sp. 31-12]|uniref:AI-2E family transporter n=1 Tax=Uliginosibacterium sp. 31-12 TaxID=3062781 RepID=UPI0026E289FD|nr:AI-2E family transporter [Uliginosibacterium sp. 31-12]MDO6386992.1 AI-2E family transporter [Uliginosibacterium sp. 31-12]